MGTTHFILNISGWETVCERAVVADRPLRRMRGLLGRSSIEAGEGMLLRPAPSIHTAFMRFPIDVLFLDADLRVLSVVHDLAPWRAAAHRKARSVLELAAGEIARRGIEPGNQLLVLYDDPSREDEEALPPEPPRRTEIRLPTRFRAAQRDGQRSRHPVSAHTEGEPAPISILLVSGDRRFRAVASTLLERRGCSVAIADERERLSTVDIDAGPDVVLFDADRATSPPRALAGLRAEFPQAGVVLVGEMPARTAGLLVRPKWGVFDDLVSAIDDANLGRGYARRLAEPA
jgi:uncharacterized membrane protein (UPF0127 family)